MDIRAIIFDLGRVLIDFDHTIAARKIAPYTDKTPAEIYNLFFDSGVTVRFEAGAISPEDFFKEVQQMLELRLGYEEFVPIWNEIFFVSESNKQVHAIAQGLQGRYQVAVLSNINQLHFEYLKKNFSLFGAFSQVFTSCGLGYVKPDIRIYKKVLQALAVEPAAAFYTDDRPELVESARTLGMRSFVFMDAPKLVRDLASVGVKA